MQANTIEPDDILKPIQPCSVGNGQHGWIPTTGKGMQCYSCPMCEQMIYWSDILKKWVKVIPKKSETPNKRTRRTSYE